MGSQARSLGEAPDRDEPLVEEVRRFYEEHHDGIERARHARRYFYDYLTRVLQTRIPPGQAILDIGCGDRSPPGRPSTLPGSRHRPLRAGGGGGHGGPRLSLDALRAGRRGRSRRPAGPRRALRRHPARQRGHPSRRRAGDPRGPAAPLPRADAGDRLQLQPPLAADAAPRGAPPPQVPAAAGGLAAPEEIQNMLSLADFETVRTDKQSSCPRTSRSSPIS